MTISIRWAASTMTPVQLLNIYYETLDNWLRGHDMGLRIRGEKRSL